MDWYYSRAGKQEGPVSETQFDDLVRNGTITLETLVWRQGMAAWQPYRLAQGPLGDDAAVAVADGVTCSECGRVFPQSEAVSYGGAWVCAGCKPVFLQRIKEGLKPAGVMMWRSGKYLVMKQGSGLPDYCIKCNAPAQGGRLKRKLYWHHPAIYLLILVSLLIYVIVALVVRKRADVEIGVCERHRTKRTRDIGLSWLVALVGLGLIVVAVSYSSGWMGLAGGVALLTGLIYGAVTVPLVAAKKIEGDIVWLRGACKEYLDGYPEWGGPP